MELSERYEKETGKKAIYISGYIKEYVWWLEQKILDAKNCLGNASLSNPMEVVENTYKILKG